jgi:hypothetical protein
MRDVILLLMGACVVVAGASTSVALVEHGVLVVTLGGVAAGAVVSFVFLRVLRRMPVRKSDDDIV